MAIYTVQNVAQATSILANIEAQFPVAGEAIGPVATFLKDCDVAVEQQMIILMLRSPWGMGVLEAGLISEKVEILFLD